MRLVLYVDGREWIEVPVRSLDSVAWQAAQIKRENKSAIDNSRSWCLVLILKSKMLS